MEKSYLIEVCFGVVLTFVGYFLNRTMSRIDILEGKVLLNKEGITENASKTKLMEVTTASKITRLDEKFDVMQQSIENLTKEIKELNITVRKSNTKH